MADYYEISWLHCMVSHLSSAKSLQYLVEVVVLELCNWRPRYSSNNSQPLLLANMDHTHI